MADASIDIIPFSILPVQMLRGGLYQQTLLLY